MEQVFVDGAALYQLADNATPGTGQFSVTSDRKVLIADDPTGRTVEVTTRASWITITSNNVTVQGFRMRHSGNAAQYGGIQIDDADSWIVRDNILSDTSGSIVEFSNSPNGRLLNNELFNGGQMAFGGQSDHVLIEGNAIHHNNTEEFSTSWEAGGSKISNTTGAVVKSNHVYLNDGPGFWCDIDCVNVTYSHNNIHHNQGIGIFIEISDGATIHDNSVWENNWGSSRRPWAYESGILIASTSNAELYNNVVAWNGDGITVVSQCRQYLADGITCDTTHPWNRVSGNYVHDNRIIGTGDPIASENVYSLGWVRDIRDENDAPYLYMFTPEANNTGSNNGYWVPQPEGSSNVRFSWSGSQTSSLAAFNATPGEENGYYLTDGERDLILTGSGIPTTPEDHTITSPMPGLLHPNDQPTTPPSPNTQRTVITAVGDLGIEAMVLGDADYEVRDLASRHTSRTSGSRESGRAR